jgi:hypothetical protein
MSKIYIPEKEQKLIPWEHIRKERHFVDPCSREVVSNVMYWAVLFKMDVYCNSKSQQTTVKSN